ncbi:hypothetical protein LMA04_02310 [Pseudescherichia vulneris]|uniref:hypothetical protein n=1 Tax=Pseudescherichia vulneris TaxID=566 RepID=UPI00227CF2A3|nr:hypothetical protein [Pseudescherichia vulneris]WAH52910.1 hypothetical protein LMA04_02310 [Pseudescherichia vulneris]
MQLKEDEHVGLANIQEVIGEAAAWLMNSRLPVNADNLMMVLRARRVMVKEEQLQRTLETSIRYLRARLVKPL